MCGLKLLSLAARGRRLFAIAFLPFSFLLFTLVFFVAVYFVLVSGGAETYSRFRVPIMPVYALSAAIGLDAGLKWMAEGFKKGSFQIFRDA